MQSIQHVTLDNGLHLITEQVPDVRTVALEWLVPAGVATNEHDGDSVLLTELMFRGAGGLSDKEHTKLLDMLGIRRDITCGVRHLTLHALSLGSRIHQAINPVFDMFLCPKLPPEGLIPSQQLCLQAIESLQDNPPRLVNLALNTHHFPSPFNRSTYGEAKAIASATIERVQHVYQSSVCPAGSILSITGDVDHTEIQDAVHSKTSDWTGTGAVPKAYSTPNRGIHHIKQDTAQVHIGLAIDAPDAGEKNSILERIAVSIFGGTSSGRLFTEVRQKRSLCYSVHASYQSSIENSTVRVHAGTTPERATETINVILDQLALLREGVTDDEFNRAITRLRAGTVMSGESTAARAKSLLGDQYALGKTRTLQERLDELDEVSLCEVNNYLDVKTFGTMTLVFLGSKALEIEENRVLGR